MWPCLARTQGWLQGLKSSLQPKAIKKMEIPTIVKKWMLPTTLMNVKVHSSPVQLPDEDIDWLTPSLSRVQLFETPWTVACQASLTVIISQSLLKLMSIESLMPSNHLSHPLLSPSPAFYLSQHQGFFNGVSSSHQVARVLELQLQHQSFQWIFRVDIL